MPWQIEVFSKQIKQTLQLADFLGTSANAVRWQVWTALLVYLLCAMSRPFRLEPQLQSPFHRPALGVMEKVGFARVAPHLWDSRWSVSLSRLSTAGLISQDWGKAMGQHTVIRQNSNNQL